MPLCPMLSNLQTNKYYGYVFAFLFTLKILGPCVYLFKFSLPLAINHQLKHFSDCRFPIILDCLDKPLAPIRSVKKIYPLGRAETAR